MPQADGLVGAVNLRHHSPDDWKSLRVLQLLFGDEEVAAVADREGRPAEPGARRETRVEDRPVDRPSGVGEPLSPIAEGSEDDDLEELSMYLQHTDPELQNVLDM